MALMSKLWLVKTENANRQHEDSIYMSNRGLVQYYKLNLYYNFSFHKAKALKTGKLCM